MYDIKYHYYLNHNYGKVAIESTLEREAVGVIAKDGRLEHKVFDGEVDYENAAAIEYNEVGYLTAFFGSPGYREHESDSWTFINSPNYLMALVILNKCYVVIQDGAPRICSPDTTHYKAIHKICSDDPFSIANEKVVSLSAFRSKRRGNLV